MQNNFIFLRKLSVIFLLAGPLLTSCTKYLDEKPNKTLVVPTTLNDAVALLNGYSLLQTAYPSLPFISSDDYYATDAYISSVQNFDRDVYLWNTTTATNVLNQWRNPYSTILTANTALQVLHEIKPTSFEENTYRSYTGKAYFLRSSLHFWIAQIFAPPYDPAKAAGLPGIPLKLKPDVDEPVVRSSIEQTYAQIIRDADSAIALLPSASPGPYMPDKAAALVLKANIALQMQQYSQALEAVTQALTIRSALINFNTLNPSASVPFQRFNAEVLFHAVISGSGLLSVNNWRTDSLLVKMYLPDDLRRSIFFAGTGTNPTGFKGDFGGSGGVDVFCGISMAEGYLVKAECEARAGNAARAMETLNALLVTRWKTGTFIPYKASDSQEALSIVLGERRKELIGRHHRWFDLRRLNLEPGRAVTCNRNYNGTIYQLLPNDVRYTFLIPQIVIDLSGIEQNPR